MDRIYATNNTGLAMALLAGGLRLIDECPVTQVYTDGFLKEHGASSFEDARDRVIPILKRKGMFGTVTYNFEATEQLDALKKAYDDQMRRMAAGETVVLEKIEPEEAVRLAATIQHNRKACLKGLTNMVPMMAVARGKGWVACPQNATPEVLAKLDL